MHRRGKIAVAIGLMLAGLVGLACSACRSDTGGALDAPPSTVSISVPNSIQPFVASVASTAAAATATVAVPATTAVSPPALVVTNPAATAAAKPPVATAARPPATTVANPVVAQPPAAPAAQSFPNCIALNAVYPHGVGRPGAVDHVSGSSKPVTTFLVDAALYAANAGRDGDNDGIACEKA